MRTQGSDEASDESEVETELVEVKNTDAPPPRPLGGASAKLKSAKKKMTKFLGKVKKKGSALSLAASTRSKSFRSVAFSAATFSAANSSGVSTYGEDSVEQEERKRVLIEPVIVADSDNTMDNVTLSVEAISTSPTERTSSDIAAKAANKEDAFSCSSTHVSGEEKENKQEPQQQEKESQVESPTAKEEQQVPQTNTSETGGASDDDESVVGDDDQTDPNTLNFLKVSKRTYIMSESESIVEESWSKEEKAQGRGFFGCGLCAPREEWEDEYDDFTVETGSEEGRVADAVITIQEHARRLGITERELLEMIQDQ